MSLRINQVSRHFDGVVALDDVSIEVPAGSITAIVGPSGSGKTTLLRLLAGLDHPDAGEVSINGQAVRLGSTALCFQDAPLYPHLTVSENVAFPLRIKAGRRSGRPGATAEQRVREVLSMLRIDHLSGRRIAELSGGQKQRVGIARALVRDVQVYLFDEPMAHLDEQLAREIIADLRHIQQTLGLTFVYITHSKDEAFSVADQMVVLYEGRVAQFGRPEALVDHPASLFVAEFLAATALNVDKQGAQVTATRPEDVAVVLDRTGVAVEQVTYLGSGWLIRTARGAGVSPVSLMVGDRVRLEPRRCFTFPV